FNYVGAESIASVSTEVDEEFRDLIFHKKNELFKALESEEIRKGGHRDKIDQFFEKVSRIISEMDALKELYSSAVGEERKKAITEKMARIGVEWMLNKGQIDRLIGIAKMIETQNKQIEKYYRPINVFIDSVNHFFSDTGKVVKVDPVGNILFERPNASPLPIQFLSSGEKQILIMFSHALFNQFTSRSGVLIIDEPELSMHLRWQQDFVCKMLDVWVIPPFL